MATKEWRELHPEYQREYVSCHGKTILAQRAKRREANRESLRTYNREYQRRRRAKLKAGKHNEQERST